MTEKEIRQLAHGRCSELETICEERLAKDLLAVYRAGFREGARERRRQPEVAKKASNPWYVSVSRSVNAWAKDPRDAAREALALVQESLASAYIEVREAGSAKVAFRCVVTEEEEIGQFSVERPSEGE